MRSLTLQDSTYTHNVYRISILKVGLKVEVVGINDMSPEPEERMEPGWYDDVSDLPEWVQKKLAVLMVCRETPPTPIIPGVGRRISVDIFWVFAE